ncbi:MAG: hypothetical protein HKM05_11220 [Spirochaetales bacterium]|nr:hypothetical protein [Spirochaetales bacterium]
MKVFQGIVWGVGLLALVGCASSPATSSVSLGQALDEISQTAVMALKQTPDAVSVSSFVNVNDRQAQKTKTFGDYTADTILADLKAQAPNLPVVERTELDKVLKERQYSSEGLLTSDKLKNLGAFLPARFILTGNFTVFPKMVELDARLLDVRNGTVAASQVVDVSADADVRSLLSGVLPQPQSIEQIPQTTGQVTIFTTIDNDGYRYPLARAREAARVHRVNQALGFYQQAVHRFPRQSAVWAAYGEYLEQLHRFPAALWALNHSLALHRTPTVLRAHARALWALGRRVQAKREWAQANALAREWREGND